MKVLGKMQIGCTVGGKEIIEEMGLQAVEIMPGGRNKDLSKDTAMYKHTVGLSWCPRGIAQNNDMSIFVRAGFGPYALASDLEDMIGFLERARKEVWDAWMEYFKDPAYLEWKTKQEKEQENKDA